MDTMNQQDPYYGYKNTYYMLLVNLIKARNEGYIIREDKKLQNDFCGKLFEYECGTKKEMRRRKRGNDILKETILDRHKLSACICATIIEVRPLIGKEGESLGKDAKYLNEAFALYMGMECLRHSIIEIKLKNIPSEKKEEKRKELSENYMIHLPEKDAKLCDKSDYFKNMCYDFANTYKRHKDCEVTNCYRFDIFAYAKIFYHLELENKIREMVIPYATADELAENIKVQLE